MPRSSACLSGLLALALAALACGGDSLSPPTSGTLEVTTSTAGVEPDQDGYSVQLDAEPAGPIGPAATVQTTDITPGNHTVQVAGIAANCTLAGENPRTVSIAAGETTTVEFTVSCSATTGSVRVSSSSSGPSPDADGYILTLDGTERGTLGTSGGVSVDALPPGDHLVGLSGVAGNCQVQGDNPRTVTVTAGQSAEVAFTVTCSPPPANTGTLRIAVATTGPDPDPNGYTFTVDGGATQTLAVNATATLTNVSIGAHLVRLSGIAGNCAVQGTNPRSAIVSSGATVDVSFAVSCPTPSATYRAIDLGTLGGSSRANAINAAGQVVGQSEIPRGDIGDEEPSKIHAFLWENGVMKDLGALGSAGYESWANDINASGQVVGASGGHAFLWQNGVMTDLQTLGCTGCNEATGINSAGQVVGSMLVPLPPPSTGWDTHAILWENGVLTDLGTLGGTYSAATAINDAGQVVGTSKIPGEDTDHAFLWEKGVMTDLGALGGTTVATDINAAGQVVGYGRAPVPGQMVRNYHFLWDKGVMTDMATLGNPGSAQAINAAGLIVGWTRNPPSTQQELRALIWQEGVVTLLPRQGAAWNINDEGQVVGESSINNGNLHATLWTRE